MMRKSNVRMKELRENICEVKVLVWTMIGIVSLLC